MVRSRNSVLPYVIITTQTIATVAGAVALRCNTGAPTARVARANMYRC